MDSATAAAWALSEGFELVALTVDYGQRHSVELDAARRVAQTLSIGDHRLVRMDLRAVGGSALTDDELDVPHGRAVSQIGAGVPLTYVPARNAVLLSLALGLAEVVGAEHIVVGVNARDYSGYPDCRPEFLRAFEALAAVATQAGVEGRAPRIHAPLMDLTKAGIAALAARLGLDLGLTHTCYDPSPAGLACGTCDACLLRSQGFAEAGLPDPTPYA